MKVSFSQIFSWFILGLVMMLSLGKIYLNPSFPYTHDGENHLARFANYKIALKEGQFPPRLAPNLLNRYTYPVFNYNYPLANILSLPGSLIKLNYETSFKIIAILAVIGAIAGLNLWLEALGFGLTSRWLASLSLISTPYLVNLIWFRGNIGEMLALSLFTWGLWLTELWVKKSSWKISWWLMLVGAGVLLAHNIAAMILVPILILHGWGRLENYFNLSGWQARLKLTAIWLGALSLSWWFWGPALMEKPAIVLDNINFVSETGQFFSSLSQLIYSPLRFGFAYPGSANGLSPSLGLVAWTCLLLTGIWIAALATRKRLKKIDQTIGILWLICLSLIFMQTKLSQFIWQALPVLNFIQFPWRLGLPLSILALPVVSYIFEQLKGAGLRWLIVVSLIIQFWLILGLKPVDFFHHSIQDYDFYPQTTSTSNENLPKNFKFIEYGELKPAPMILAGSGEVAVQKWTGTTKVYDLKLITPSLIVEPSIVFPGFETRANGQLVNYTDSEIIQGRLAYELPAGEYKIQTKFTQNTWPRLSSNLISMLAWIGLIYWGVMIFKSSKYA